VFAGLGSQEDHDHERSALDTRATHHMTNSKLLFSLLNTQIYDTVKFSDGSITKIEGWGSILLNYKNGEHRVLTGVYYIPRLKASIGQHDEIDCRIDTSGGILHILD
jgi:hypothetical protein